MAISAEERIALFPDSACPSLSGCCQVKSISEGSIEGCLLENNFCESLSTLKHDEGRLEVFFFFTLLVLAIYKKQNKKESHEVIVSGHT